MGVLLPSTEPKTLISLAKMGNNGLYFLQQNLTFDILYVVACHLSNARFNALQCFLIILEYVILCRLVASLDLKLQIAFIHYKVPFCCFVLPPEILVCF